jgi:hypothetical protein
MWLWRHAEDRLTAMQMTPPCPHRDNSSMVAGSHIQSEFIWFPLCIYKRRSTSFCVRVSLNLLSLSNWCLML